VYSSCTLREAMREAACTPASRTAADHPNQVRDRLKEAGERWSILQRELRLAAHERDEAIREAASLKIPRREIARLVGVSLARVQQVVLSPSVPDAGDAAT